MRAASQAGSPSNGDTSLDQFFNRHHLKGASPLWVKVAYVTGGGGTINICRRTAPDVGCMFAG
jgi:hypothetical protein